MHSRRTRIKGIANIPQRRKVNTDDVQVKTENIITEIQTFKECQNIEAVGESNKNGIDCHTVSHNIEPTVALNLKKESSHSRTYPTNPLDDVNKCETNELFPKNHIIDAIAYKYDRVVGSPQRESPTDTLDGDPIHSITEPTSVLANVNTCETKDGNKTESIPKNPIGKEIDASNERNLTKDVKVKILHEIKTQVVPTRRKIIKPAVSLNRAVIRKVEKESKFATKVESIYETSNEEIDTAPTIENSEIGNKSSIPSDVSSTFTKPSINTDTVNKAEIISGKVEKNPTIKTYVTSTFTKPIVNNNTATEIIPADVSVEKNSKTENQGSKIHETRPQVAPLRRKFIKPSVSLSRATNRKVDTEPKSTVKEESLAKIHGEEIDRIIKEDSDNTNRTSTSLTSGVATLNEIHLFTQNDKNTVSVEAENPQKKPVMVFSSHHLSDTEYPPPPPSPSKINRARIKAVPRLGYRKASFSASESEDESRRNSHRIRNDSVCSTTSVIADSMSECMSPMRPKESAVIATKKCVRNEQTRKLAEARLEFRRKFGFSTPDRQQLTMMDLIFYNPVTNPIEKTEKPTEKVIVAEEEVVDDPVPVEDVDDPQDEGDKVDDDDETAMPVPQIKIGPSGEIMLDEKSLVVERKGLKRQIEEIEKSKLVDGDVDSSYGIYKRHKRGAKWSPIETVRFYRALNTLGTDFGLMVELFPNRTRRDLKLKFNREEKTNRMLIDKALMQPCQYAFDSLKLDMEKEIRIQEERQKQIEEDIEIKKQRKGKKRIKAKEAKEDPKPIKIKKRPRKKDISIKSLMNDSDADVSDIGTQSASEDELVLSHTSTRSGRMPKVTKKFEPEPIPVKKETKNTTKKTKHRKKIEEAEIEPGSIVIVNEVGPNNEPVYKIFMVTPDQGKTPIDLPSEELSKLMQFKKGMIAKNILTISATPTDDEEAADEPPPVENNMTIVEDANVTNLKSDTHPTSEKLVMMEDGNDADAGTNHVIISDNTIVEDGSVTTKNYLTKIEERPIENNMTVIDCATVTNNALPESNVNFMEQEDDKSDIKAEKPSLKKTVNVISDQIVVLGIKEENTSPEDSSSASGGSLSVEESNLTEETVSDILKYVADGRGVAIRLTKTEHFSETNDKVSQS